MQPFSRPILLSLDPKKIIQNAAASGTKICSQIPGHPEAYPNPLVPTRVIPLQMEQMMRRVNSQNPRLLPASM